MKRLFMVFLFIGFLLPSVYGQTKRHTIFAGPIINLDLNSDIGIGAGYDLNLGKYFSIGVMANYHSDYVNSVFENNYNFENMNDIQSYSFLLSAKLFPLRTKIGNLVINVEVGYCRKFSSTNDYQCLIVNNNYGFKFIFGNGFTITPMIGTTQNALDLSGTEFTRTGLNPRTAINFKLMLGYMF